MLIAPTTLVTRASVRVRVRGLLGLLLGLLYRVRSLGLRPLRWQALPAQLHYAQGLRFGPPKALGVGESRRWPILRGFGSLYTSLLGSL